MPTSIFDTIGQGVSSIITQVVGAMLMIVGIFLKVAGYNQISVREWFGRPIMIKRRLRLRRAWWPFYIEHFKHARMIKGGPGPKISFPGFYASKIINLREQPLNPGAVRVPDKNGVMRIVDMSMPWRFMAGTRSITRSSYSVENLLQLLYNKVRHHTKLVAHTLSYNDEEWQQLPRLISDDCRTPILREYGIWVCEGQWNEDSPTDTQQNFDAMMGVAEAIRSLRVPKWAQDWLIALSKRLIEANEKSTGK